MRMIYKLVLVEDEQYLLEFLKKVIDWSMYNVEIVATATDGISGYETVMKNNPDIVMSDICMMGEDGLKMIERLRESGYTGYAVILSGFEVFEYAKKAIDLGVDKYLLKPINIEELKETIATICKNIEQKGEAGRENIPEAYSPFINSIIKYIDEHYCEEISLSVVAKEFHTSHEHMSRIFKQATGMKYIDYITKKRIDKAKELLMNTDLKMYEILEVLGYKDMSHFKRTFFKLEGETPSEYRSKFQKR